jgi:catechol 2,3-dioxygenase-like lactoylglutathione lyase family enzyme
VALNTPDVERAEKFYTRVLGYRVEWRPDPENVYLTNGSDNLALHKGPAASGTEKLDHIGIMLKQADDVDAWAAHLRAHSVKILKEPKTHRDGARSFYTADPDGVVIQFIHHPPLAEGK